MIFVIFAIVAVALLAGIPGGWLYNQHTKQIKQYGYSAKLTASLSTPALEIMENYQRIPVSNRPQGDMYRVVVALDKKHGGKEKVNEHFTKKERYGHYGQRHFNWNDHDLRHGCTLKYDGDRLTGTCSMTGYKGIKFQLQEIEKALGEQEYALEMAGISGDVELAERMIEQMRAERETIEYVTKGLTNKELT